MSHNLFGHFSGNPPSNAGTSGGGINPNDLYASSFSNFGSSNHHGANAFGQGSAGFNDDELLDGLSSDASAGLHGHDVMGGVPSSVDFHNASHNQNGNLYPNIDTQVSNFSHTPEADIVHSPFGQSYNSNHHFHAVRPIQSPMSGYSGSPVPDDDAGAFLKTQNRLSQHIQSPMSPKVNAMHAFSLGSTESPGFGALSRDKSVSGQWVSTATPTGTSIPQSYGFSSPIPNLINDVIAKGGASMPAKLTPDISGPLTPQELKRKRRRESHNLVERRRRDNINERIQDLSRLVPTHRLEDEKIRKLIQNGTPMSPTLGAATSSLAGPGARRATGSTAGNITTGLPLEEKDKGPNKGDILNGAVSWTRDLMWMLHLKLQQQEELMNIIAELGGSFPFELTEDEKRMQTELMEAMAKNDGIIAGYTRTAGSGLRVPHHTDYRGEPLNGADHSASDQAIQGHVDNGYASWNDLDGGSRRNSVAIKTDEFDMDLQ